MSRQTAAIHETPATKSIQTDYQYVAPEHTGQQRGAGFPPSLPPIQATLTSNDDKSTPSTAHTSSAASQSSSRMYGVHTILNPSESGAVTARRESNRSSYDGESSQNPMSSCPPNQHVSSTNGQGTYLPSASSATPSPINAGGASFTSAGLSHMGSRPYASSVGGNPLLPQPYSAHSQSGPHDASPGTPNENPVQASFASMASSHHGRTTPGPGRPQTGHASLEISTSGHAKSDDLSTTPVSGTQPGTYQFMTLQTEQGPVSFPVDIQAASRMADEKRRRNAGASARFRARRKEKEQANSREIEEMKQQIRDLHEDVDFYRRERDYFLDVVRQTPDRERHFPRPVSPRRRRSSGDSMTPRETAPVPLTPASTGPQSQDMFPPYQEQGGRGLTEKTSRRRLNADPSFFPPQQPVNSTYQPSGYGKITYPQPQYQPPPPLQTQRFEPRPSVSMPQLSSQPPPRTPVGSTLLPSQHSPQLTSHSEQYTSIGQNPQFRDPWQPRQDVGPR